MRVDIDKGQIMANLLCRDFWPEGDFSFLSQDDGIIYEELVKNWNDLSPLVRKWLVDHMLDDVIS